MQTKAGDDSWDVRSVQVSSQRVEAEVDGHQVWVACDDAPLADVPEAWATAFCFPAARARSRLSFTAPLDPAWRAGAARNIALASSWWGGLDDLAMEVPFASSGSIARRVRSWTADRTGRSAPSPAAPGRALCVTGGVDSFFSLLSGAHHPTHLLFVVGFDVELDDEERAKDVISLVRDVARERHLQALIVRTNLRSHPRFASISWEHTHGAALAAIGHLLAPTVSALVIPPSYAIDRLVPWGSRPDLDPGWSIPGRLQVEHGDAGGRRLDRVRTIANDPLVQRHLRVCWQNVGTDANCGRCEKCVRTMAMLAGCGALEACTTFPDRAVLTRALDALDPIPAGLQPLWTDLLATDLTDVERTSIERLLERSSVA